MAVNPKYYKIHTDGCSVALEPIYTELVQVVRCEDCKYWKSYGGSMKYYGECEGTSKDELWGEDDFCSHGERKDGDG